jgi:tetratricopeptide (TPR) repeat protein
MMALGGKSRMITPLPPVAGSLMMHRPPSPYLLTSTRASSTLLTIAFALSTTGCSILTEPRPTDQSKKTFDLSVERTRSVVMDRDISRASEGYYQFLVGQLRYDAEDFSGAMMSLRRAEALIGTPVPELNVRLAELELKEGNLEAALQQSTQALEVEPSEVKVLLLHAGILDALERGAEALPFYEQVIEKEPTSVDGYLILSGLLMKLNRNAEAISVLKRYIPNDPDDSLVLYFLGRAYEATDDLAEAESSIHRAYELNPENLPICVDYARILVRRSKNSQAKEICRHILERDPRNIIARKILGTLLISENELDEALEQLRLLEDVEEDTTDTRFKIALIHIQKQQFQEAERELQLIIAQQPEHGGARYYLATILASTNKLPQALEQISQIPTTNELYAKANAFASFICKEANNIPCALESIKKAYEADNGQSPQIFTFYITILREAKKLEEARTLLESAIGKQSEAYDLRYDYVMTLHDLGEEEAAYQEARSIIAAQPDHPESLNFVAYLMAERGEDLVEAEKLSRRAIHLRPREGYFHDTLGWIILKRGRIDEAIIELRHATELLPRDPTILEHLGDALAVKDQHDEAAKVYERAIEAFGTSAAEPATNQERTERQRLEEKRDAAKGKLQNLPSEN